MKKILTIAIIIILLLPGSAFHGTLLVMLLVWLWRKNVRRSFSRWWRKGYRTLWRVLSCISLILMPRPFALPTDRSRLVYYNDYGQRMTPPVTHWLINLLLPEETLCSLGCALPESALRDMLPAGGAPISESQSLQETLRQISGAYRRNDLALESPLSGVVPQALSRYFGSDTKAAYVIKPKNYDSRRDYPVLFFPRGDMDNCKLYTGMLRDIEDTIIVCVGTDTTSDTIGRADFQQIKSRFIPLLRDLGLNPDISRISLFSTADCESIWQYLDEGSSSQQ